MNDNLSLKLLLSLNCTMVLLHLFLKRYYMYFSGESYYVLC